MKPAALVLCMLLLVVACGGDTAEVPTVAAIAPSTSSTTIAAQDSQDSNEAEAAVLAFTACLREEGVELPDPTVDSEGNPQFTEPPDLSNVSSDELGDALEACREELERVTIGVIGTDLTGLEDALLEYAQCMRQNGFDMQDPDLSFDFSEGFNGPFGEIDFDDPTFVAADEQCSHLVEQIGAGS